MHWIALRYKESGSGVRIKKVAVATGGGATGGGINVGAGGKSGATPIIIAPAAGIELKGRGLSSLALLKGIFCGIGDEIAVEIIKFHLSIL